MNQAQIHVIEYIKVMIDSTLFSVPSSVPSLILWNLFLNVPCQVALVNIGCVGWGLSEHPHEWAVTFVCREY